MTKRIEEKERTVKKGPVQKLAVKEKGEKPFNKYLDIIPGQAYRISKKIDKGTTIKVGEEEQKLRWYNQTIVGKGMISETIIETAFTVMWTRGIIRSEKLEEAIKKIKKGEGRVLVEASTLTAILYTEPEILKKYTMAEYNKDLAILYRTTYKGIEKLGIAEIMESILSTTDPEEYTRLKSLEHLELPSNSGEQINITNLCKESTSNMRKEIEYLGMIKEKMKNYWVKTFNEICRGKILHYARTLLSKTGDVKWEMYGWVVARDVVRNIYPQLGNLRNKGKRMADETIMKRLLYLFLPPGDVGKDLTTTELEWLQANNRKINTPFPGKKTYSAIQIAQYLEDLCALITIVTEVNKQYIAYFGTASSKEVMTRSFFPVEGFTIGIPSSVMEEGTKLSIEQTKNIVGILESTRNQITGYVTSENFYGKLLKITRNE